MTERPETCGPAPVLVERVARILDDHRRGGDGQGEGTSCRCGVNGIVDHSRHVAEQIVAHLGLRRETAEDIATKVRYVSAWVDQELTTLEGAE